LTSMIWTNPGVSGPFRSPLLVTIPVGDNETAPRRATGCSRRPVATAWTRRTWLYFSGLVANVPVSVSMCIGRMGERALTL
jgi:hypothetical protein